MSNREYILGNTFCCWDLIKKFLSANVPYLIYVVHKTAQCGRQLDRRQTLFVHIYICL